MLKTDIHTHPYHQDGFTVVELIVVITIISILTAMGGVMMHDYIVKSRHRETARSMEGDLNQIRTIARTRQDSRIVLVISSTGYQAFIDANANKTYDAGEEQLVENSFASGISVSVSGGATIPFSALGTISDDVKRLITISSTSNPGKRFRITLYTTGTTLVERSENGTTYQAAW